MYRLSGEPKEWILEGDSYHRARSQPSLQKAHPGPMGQWECWLCAMPASLRGIKGPVSSLCKMGQLFLLVTVVISYVCKEHCLVCTLGFCLFLKVALLSD
jgi:hypothetical protein